jgi:hypothetical protein
MLHGKMELLSGYHLWKWEGSLCCREECRVGESWKETFLGWEGFGREEEGDLRMEIGGGRGWEGGWPSP